MSAVGSIAWYAERLSSDHAYLTRQLHSLYCDAAHTIVAARENGRLTDATSTALWDAPDEYRLGIWILDSMLWTIEEFQAGRYTHALRGYVQACGYGAKLGRSPDALITLRNALESVTEYVVARETDCRCGVRIIDCHNDTIGSHDIRLRDRGVS